MPIVVLMLVAVFIGYWPIFLSIPFFMWLLPFLDRKFGSQAFWDKAAWLGCWLCALSFFAILTALWLAH